MTTATNPYPDVALPAGARTLDTWQSDDPQPYRVILAAVRKVTDHALTVSPSAIQWADGSIDVDGRIEAPHIYLFGLGEGDPLNIDQARELAAVHSRKRRAWMGGQPNDCQGRRTCRALQNAGRALPR